MARKREEEPVKDNSERWLLTYADLITLLMIFFVVMYSMSKVDAEKFKSVAESLSIALGGGTDAIMEMGSPGESILDGMHLNPDNGSDVSVTQPDSGDGTGDGDISIENYTIEGIKQKLDRFALDNNIQAKLVTSVEERGLVVSIQETLLFESGSAEINPGAREILEKITDVLATAPNYIKVEGHTCNLPINTARFPSNWELSVLRATNVLHIMEGKISTNRLSAAGYGEYRPIASNDTEEGRARNRRVDLVILRSKYDVTEPGKHYIDDAASHSATLEES